ncbi:MAG: S-layer homology domain-containing protein, partial [Clostridia bacterium]|nr:S-layer homology domain-containing protein [Clostridia bacterium]
MLHIKLKKITALMLTVLMLFTVMPVTYSAEVSDFVDFPTGWSADAVKAAVDNGLLVGRTATELVPGGCLTRAEMATIVNRAFGAKIEADISSYKDVSRSAWYYHEIAKAVNMQTFQGDGTTIMRPDDCITREEVFTVIARAFVLESNDYSP